MATDSEKAITEQQKALDEVVELELEGHQDLERLNLDEVTRPSVLAQRDFASTRRQLLEAALEANRALVKHGHPIMPVASVTQESYEDLLAQQHSIAAALKKYRPNALTGVNHSFTTRKK